MLKKFNSLGTAISRNEAKMIVGGDITVLMVDLGDDAGCGELKANCVAGIQECCPGYSCISIGYHKICDSNIA